MANLHAIASFRRELENEISAKIGSGNGFYDISEAKARQKRVVDRIIAEHKLEEQDTADFRTWERKNEKYFAEQEKLAQTPKRPTVFVGKYRLTGNAFGGNFHTWRAFPAKRDIKLEDFRKTDENRAVGVAAKEAAKLGSIKIAFYRKGS